MALKPDRQVNDYDISRFMSTTGTRGGIVVATGSASGSAMDQTTNKVAYATTASGYRPIGLLLADVVNVDLTRQILNPNKSEAQINDKVPLMTKGWVVTNMVATDASTAVVVGGKAYVGHSGYITADADAVDDKGANPTAVDSDILRVGTFLTTGDEDGYYKVSIDL